MTITVTIYPVEDDTVIEDQSTGNWWSAISDYTQNDNGGNARRVTYKFKIGDYPTDTIINSATLKVKTNTIDLGGGGTVLAYGLGEFNPYVVTWATMPTWDATSADTETVTTADTWYSWNVGSIVASFDTYAYIGLKSDEDAVNEDYTWWSNTATSAANRPYLELVLDVPPVAIKEFTVTDQGNSLTDTANVTLDFTWGALDPDEYNWVDNLTILYDTDPTDLTSATPETDSTVLEDPIETPDQSHTDTLTVPGADDRYYFRVMSENADHVADAGTGGEIIGAQLRAKPTTPALTIGDNGPDVGEPVIFTLQENGADTGKVEYYIDFDDNTNSGWVSGGTIKHYYITNETVTPVGYVRWNAAQGKTQMISTGVSEGGTPDIVIGVPNPVAKLDVVASAHIDDTIILNASGSYNKLGYITKYEFDVDGDADYDIDNGTDPIYTTSFGSGGTKNVYVRVTSSATGTPTHTDTAAIVVGQRAVYDLQLNVTSCATYGEGAPRTIGQATRYADTPIVDDGGKTLPIWEFDYLNVSDTDATNDIPIFEYFRDEDDLEFVKFKYDGTTYFEGHIIDIESRRLKGGAWQYTVTAMEKAPPTEHADENYPP